jgi:hypothetical protein
MLFPEPPSVSEVLLTSEIRIIESKDRKFGTFTHLKMPTSFYVKMESVSIEDGQATVASVLMLCHEVGLRLV